MRKLLILFMFFAISVSGQMSEFYYRQKTTQSIDLTAGLAKYKPVFIGDTIPFWYITTRSIANGITLRAAIRSEWLIPDTSVQFVKGDTLFIGSDTIWIASDTIWISDSIYVVTSDYWHKTNDSTIQAYRQRVSSTNGRRYPTTYMGIDVRDARIRDTLYNSRINMGTSGNIYSTASGLPLNKSYLDLTGNQTTLGASTGFGVGGAGSVDWILAPGSASSAFNYTFANGNFGYQLDEWGFFPSSYSWWGTYNQRLGIPSNHWKGLYVDSIVCFDSLHEAVKSKVLYYDPITKLVSFGDTVGGGALGSSNWTLSNNVLKPNNETDTVQTNVLKVTDRIKFDSAGRYYFIKSSTLGMAANPRSDDNNQIFLQPDTINPFFGLSAGSQHGFETFIYGGQPSDPAYPIISMFLNTPKGRLMSYSYGIAMDTNSICNYHPNPVTWLSLGKTTSPFTKLFLYTPTKTGTIDSAFTLNRATNEVEYGKVASGSTYSAGFGLGLSTTTFYNSRYWKNQDTLKTTLTGLAKLTSGVVTTVTDNSANWNNSVNILDYGGWYGFVNNTETTLSFNPTDSTLTLTGASWNYVRDGIKYTISGNKTATITGTLGGKGTYYFYIDDGIGTITCSTVAWTLKDSKVPVAIIKWDKTEPGGFKYFIEDERHGGAGGTEHRMWPRGLHYYVHSTIGVRYQTGGQISGETVLPATASSASNQFKIAAAEIDDEDLDVILDVKGKPATAAHSWIIYKRTAASTWAWDTVAVPYPYSATYIQWDNGGTLTTGINNRFYNTYVLFTNAKDSARFIIVPGRGEYTSAALAQAEDPRTWSWSGFNIAEAVIMYRLTWSTGAAFTGALGRVKLNNTPQAITQGISSSSLGTPANQWTTIGNDIINTNSGNVGIAAQAPMSKLSIISSKATNENTLNLVQSDWNLNRTTVAQSIDTSAVHFSFTDGGKPLLSIKNNTGESVMDLDSTKILRSNIAPFIRIAGSYASTTTFIMVGNQAQCDIMYGSLLRWESTAGAIRYGWIAKATVSAGTITATCYGTAAMAANDKNYYYAPNLKARLWERLTTIPGEQVTDASNPVGMWYQGNAADTLAVFDVSAWVLTAASGAGAACSFNLYHGSTALFTNPVDLSTNTSSLDNVPTAVTLVPPSVNMTMRIISSAGATTKAANFQCRYFAVPTRIYWGL